MLDADSETCQREIITAPVPRFGTDAPCLLAPETDGTEIKRGGARPGSGRPAITSERPWDAEGISRRTYYRRISPQQPTQISYATDEPRWCVLAFWGQAEVSATTELARIGYETYLPLRAIRRQDPVVKSMWHTDRVPLFSGYGFIQITRSESRRPITETRGVHGVLLRPDGHAASVPDVLIEKLREDDATRLLLPKEHAATLGVGTKVRIEVGPFQDHVGAVVQCDGMQTQVEIELFGRPVLVWLDRVSVAAI